MALDKPEPINIGGILSYPTWTAQQAYDSAHRADSKLQPNQRPASVDQAKASVQILLNQSQLDKVVAHLIDVVLPYALEQGADGKQSFALDQSEADLLIKNIEDQNWRAKLGIIPFQPIGEATQEKAPNAVVGIQAKSYKGGQNIIKQAFVTEELQLVSKPFVKPDIYNISDTVFDMVAGDFVKSTISFYVGVYNGNPTISCNTNAVVRWKEGTPFAGGGSDSAGMLADGDDMFMDD